MECNLLTSWRRYQPLNSYSQIQYELCISHCRLVVVFCSVSDKVTLNKIFNNVSGLLISRMFYDSVPVFAVINCWVILWPLELHTLHRIVGLGRRWSVVSGQEYRHLRFVQFEVHYRCESRNFRGDRIQWNFLGQTAASKCEGFPTFRAITPSPSSGCASVFFQALIPSPSSGCARVLVSGTNSVPIFRVC